MDYVKHIGSMWGHPMLQTLAAALKTTPVVRGEDGALASTLVTFAAPPKLIEYLSWLCTAKACADEKLEFAEAEVALLRQVLYGNGLGNFAQVSRERARDVGYSKLFLG